MKRFFCCLIVFACCFALFSKESALAHPLDFTVLQLGDHGEKQSRESVPHILIIGGIQGDEPGGFSAAALLGTHYTFKNGYVTIIPNLNFLSIINRSRGNNGDMNRKFASLSKNDPDYPVVRRVQELIRSPEVDLILNLHDGGGFYHPQYVSELQNPKRWGNSIIIDQEKMDTDNVLCGNLAELAKKVVAKVNANLLEKGHSYHLKNTETAKGDKEMEKSLTWFALGQGKPAFGLEATKNLNVPGRVYYHLHAVEGFFEELGIEFSRDFELTTKGIYQALNKDIYLGFMDNRLVLPLDDIRRPQVGVFPMQKNYAVKGNSPILTAVNEKDKMQVHYGNNRLTNFKVEWLEIDTAISQMDFEIDGKKHSAKFGDIIYVADYIKLIPQKGYRLNAIGAVVGKGSKGDESGIKIVKKDFQERFSLDKNGRQYRFEVYKGKKYAGTFVVCFVKKAPENPVFTSLQKYRIQDN